MWSNDGPTLCGRTTARQRLEPIRTNEVASDEDHDEQVGNTGVRSHGGASRTAVRPSGVTSIGLLLIEQLCVAPSVTRLNPFSSTPASLSPWPFQFSVQLGDFLPIEAGHGLVFSVVTNVHVTQAVLCSEGEWLKLSVAGMRAAPK